MRPYHWEGSTWLDLDHVAAITLVVERMQVQVHMMFCNEPLRLVLREREQVRSAVVNLRAAERGISVGDAYIECLDEASAREQEKLKEAHYELVTAWAGKPPEPT